LLKVSVLRLVLPGVKETPTYAVMEEVKTDQLLSV